MKLNPNNCLLQVDSGELFHSNRYMLIYPINDYIRKYGFVENRSNMNIYKITTLSDHDRTLSEWIFIISGIIEYLEDNKILWTPGRCPFTDKDKFGFLIVKKTYLIVVTISNDGITSTKEYPLTSLAKIN
jgi:hypothetical protein